MVHGDLPEGIYNEEDTSNSIIGKLQIIELEKLEYLIGFHSEEMILRNYLY